MSDFYTSKYPITHVTADIILYHKDEVLLIKRNTEPFKDKWALIGGYFDHTDADIKETAIRECREEVGITPPDAKFMGVYSKQLRDPRGRTISHVFRQYLNTDSSELKIDKSEVKEVRWFSIFNLPEMAFDHEQILKDHTAQCMGSFLIDCPLCSSPLDGLKEDPNEKLLLFKCGSEYNPHSGSYNNVECR